MYQKETSSDDRDYGHDPDMFGAEVPMLPDEHAWKKLASYCVALELMSREIADLTEFSQIDVLQSYVRAASDVVRRFSREDCVMKTDLIFAMMRPAFEKPRNVEGF